MRLGTAFAVYRAALRPWSTPPPLAVSLLALLLCATPSSQLRAEVPKPEPTPASPSAKPQPAPTANSESPPAKPDPSPTAKPDATPAKPDPSPTAKPDATPAKPDPSPTAKPDATPAKPDPSPTAKPDATPAKPEPTPAKPETTPAEPTIPSVLDICITSIVIAPTKEDNTPWDPGGTKLSDAELDVFKKSFNEAMKIPAARQAALAAAVAGILASKAMPTLAKPDVFGTVDLAPAGIYTAKNAKQLPLASRKTPAKGFHPSFLKTACFIGILWSKKLKLRVTLTDKDLLDDDDPIGLVELQAKDVSGAYSHGKAYHASVGDQDTKNIKYVVLNVTEGATDED